MNTGNGGRFRWVALFLLVLFVVTVGLILYGILGEVNMPWNKIGQASERLASRLGWSIFLVKGLVTLASIPYFYAWSKLYPDAKKALWDMATPSFDPFFLFRDKWGATIVAYMGVFYIVLSYASKDADAYKNCAETPEGLYMTDNTGIDPHYGRKLTPCTAEQIERHRHPVGPKELSAAEVKKLGFFTISGYPQIWYTTGENGAIRLFDRPGTNQEGDPLQVVTRPIAADWYRQQRHTIAQQQSARDQQQHAAALAADSANAQQQYANGSYEQAIVSCKPVLTVNAADENCRQIFHDASLKLSQQLVSQAQTELQHGELVDASRDAGHALKLDPANGSAKNVQVAAQQLIAHNNQ